MMATILDTLRTRVRSVTSRAGGLQEAPETPFLENIKSTRSVIQKEGFIGITQKAMAGERPIMSNLIPEKEGEAGRRSSRQRTGRRSEGLQRAARDRVADKRKKTPISIVA